MIYQKVRCTAHKNNGDPCPNWAMLGQQICHTHGGGSPQARHAAAVRLTKAAALKQLARLGEEPDSNLDPITQLERLGSRCVALVDVLAPIVASLEEIRYSSDRGDEQTRAELTAYLQAIARCESVLKTIVSLDLEKMRLSIDALKVTAVVDALELALGHRRLNLTSDQQRFARALVAKQLGAPDVIESTCEEVPND
jgi:hypothetical protein